MSANIVRFSGDYKIQAGFGTNQQANIYLGTKNNGTVYVDGNLLVSGTSTSITTQNTNIKDNIITLNAGESGSHVSLTVAGIEIDRGTNSDGKAQFLFDESIQWQHPNGTTRYGLFVFKTETGNINGIRTNSIDTNGGNLNLINYSTGVIKVTGTNNYEEQVVNYDNNHHIVMPIVAKDDDIIPNIKTVIDYVSNISNVGNVGITQNGGTLNIGLNKTVTISNTLTFAGTDGSTITLGTGGTVVYTRNKLSDLSATTSAELAGVISDETGSGALVFANTPTLVTPVLGAATATTINGLTISTSTGTLTIANGKTLTASNTLTFTGTDLSNIAFGSGGTVAYTSNKLSSFSATTSAELAGVISDETGSGALVFANTPTLVTPVLGAATATTINKVTISAVATGSTLTIADNKIFTVNNTLTFNGTDSSSVEFGTGGTVTYTSNKLSSFSATTSAELAGVISDETGTGLLVFNNSPTIAGHPTIEGITSTGATGTDNLVFSNAPTITGHPTIEGITSTGATGTGNLVFSASPTLTGTVSIGTLNLTNALGIAYGGTNQTSFTAPASNINPIVYYNGTSLTNNSLASDIGYNSSTDNFFTRNITTVSLSSQSTTGGSLIQIQTDPGAAMISGNRLGGIFFGGSTNNTHTIQNRTSIESFATQTWTVSNQGAKIVFSTTPNNTNSRVAALTLDHDQLAIFSGHLTVEGVTSTGATGTGKFVFDNAPTITGHPTIEGVTSTGATGTGKLVFSISPTLSTSLLTDSTTFDLINTTATTVNFAGAATTIAIGANTGTITLANQTLTGTNLTTVNINGTNPTVATSSTGTVALFNTNATTGNLFGDATTISIGANTGTITLGNQIVTGTNLSTLNMNGTTPISISTSTASSTANIFNTNSTTGNLFGAATTINIGASSGTLTIGNATITGTNATTFNMNGSNPSIVTSSTGTANVFNTNALTGNLFGDATTVTIGAINGTITLRNQTLTGSYLSTFNMNGTSPLTIATSTGSSTANVFNTNVTTGHLFGDATTIDIGANSGTLTIGNTTVVGTQTTQNLYNTTATTMNFAGAATTTNISNSGNINLGSSTSATTTVKVGGAISGNTLKIASTASGTVNISSDVTTGTINLFTDTTTGTINVGSTDEGIVDIAFTTESTSTTTGAVVVAGGVGIEKNLYVGEATTMMFQTTDPVADTGGVTVYTKNSDLTNTGIYYVNNTTSGELVSKKKALAYSIVFG